jgi:putative membrane protein
LMENRLERFDVDPENASFATAHRCSGSCASHLVSRFANRRSRRARSNDQRFMTEAIQGDLSEVKMGKLAQEKGQGDNVKQFGKMLEQDHLEHLQKAKKIADKTGLKTPTEPNAKQQRMYQKLGSLSGSKFDTAFARDMVSDHEKDIGKYRKEANSSSDVADFAKQTVPVLQKHLQAAEALTRQMNRHAVVSLFSR